MGIQTITTFKTSDGEFFETRQAAEAHEFWLVFQQRLLESDCYLYGEVRCAITDLCDFLRKHYTLTEKEQ